MLHYLFSVADAATPQNQGSPLGMFVPLIIIFGIFYFMAIRPQQRKEKERREMIKNIKSGDRIIFGGGFIGTVANVKELTLVVKIADGVKVEIVRSAVSQILDKGEKPEENSDKVQS